MSRGSQLNSQGSEDSSKIANCSESGESRTKSMCRPLAPGLAGYHCQSTLGCEPSPSSTLY